MDPVDKNRRAQEDEDAARKRKLAARKADPHVASPEADKTSDDTHPTG